MQTNVYFPLPLPVHIAFGVFGALFFIFMFARKKSFHYLLLATSVLSTFLIYLCHTKTTRMLLGIEELILYVMILVFMFLDSRKKKKEETPEKEADKDENSNS
ncbi:MAG: hypothetical protein IKJ47_00230 [Oscillospiraceae bacterium]|nr:hypothetical protein [Oscillospiraceae bacterium]